MKKIVLVLFLAISASGAFAQALATSNSPEYKNLLKLSAALFTQSTFQLGFERYLDQNTSLYLTAGISFRDTDYEKKWGIRNEAQMKFHVYTLIKPTLSYRLYFAPYLLNQYYEIEEQIYDNNGYQTWYSDTFDAFGGGMLFGWSFSFANRINLDIYTGGGIRKTFNFDPPANYYDDGITDPAYNGIVPRFGIDIGFWF